jgi:hypothetical protein
MVRSHDERRPTDAQRVVQTWQDLQEIAEVLPRTSIIYVVSSSPRPLLSGLLRIQHNICAGNTCPRKCCLQHFLGFIFICGRSRRGAFQLQRKTRGDRMRAKLRQIKEELRRRMHDSIPMQGQWLRQVVRGYFAYHAVPTNSRAICAFRHHVTNLWRRTLRRRSQKDAMTWARMARIANAWLPRPRILHPWPSERFAVKHPR